MLESGGGEARNGGDIITEKTYRHFILQVDFKITKGANSGIKYFVDPELNKGPGSAIGCEFQILDNENHPDAKLGVKGNRTLGALYDLIPPEVAPEVPKHYLFNGIGQWNRAIIEVRGCRVTHYLNEAEEGHILLQDHGNEVSFRNIKIKELAPKK